jgi:hypothetical protein
MHLRVGIPFPRNNQLSAGDKLLVLEPRLFSDVRRQLNVEDRVIAEGFHPEKLASGEINAKFSEVRRRSGPWRHLHPGC